LLENAPAGSQIASTVKALQDVGELDGPPDIARFIDPQIRRHCREREMRRVSAQAPKRLRS
jgi:hypothetical protein